MERGDHFTAAEAMQSASDLRPDDVGLARVAARAWRQLGARHRSRLVLERCLQNDDLSRLSETDSYDLGAECLEAGSPSLALRCFRVTARTRSDSPALQAAMASALRSLGDLDEAWRLAKRAAERDKKNPAVLLTAAQVRHAQGEFAEAIAWLKKAEAVRPFHGPTRLQRGLTRLITGPTRQGWEDFENRGLPELPSGAAWWRGEELAGRSIRVVMEQGTGDLFHFLRYFLPLLNRDPSTVVLEAPKSAVSLLRAAGYPAFSKGEGPQTELAIPILSLPLRLGLHEDTLPASVPYIRLPEGLQKQGHLAPAQPGMSSGKVLRLGLVPAGNPDFLATNLRDLDALALANLLEIPGVEWYWLLPGTQPPKAITLHEPNLSSEWFDTASLLTELDGIVSVDTGLAHLAGAMGLKTLLLLPFTPDWRWKFVGETTPWYPSMQILRQTKPASWLEVIERIPQALSHWRM